MSDDTPKKKQGLDVADVKAQLGVAETQLPLDMARDRAHEEKKKQEATLASRHKFENDKGDRFVRHRDHNHLQQPGGAMRGS